jgi:exopolysaccharide biosynthesis predicted pyruvyltransferase EpsI
VSFIPHLRDELVYKGKYPKNIKVIKIDDKPYNIAKKILKSKIVYASSLHGIIFSHALNKPCVFVKPQSHEPIFKYRDYFLSVGIPMPEPIKDIYSINYRLDKQSILSNDIGIEDFYFPNLDTLKEKGLVG